MTILMRNSITIDNSDVINNQRINSLGNLGATSVDKSRNNSVQKALTTEDSENFVKYIEQLHLDNDLNQVVLSSSHHYYYDAEEMTNVKTVINLKELNQVKQLKDFIHTMYHILPANCNFIGCFVNNKKQSGFTLNTNPSDFYYKRNSNDIENGIASSSPLLNKLYNMIDSKTNKYMSERSVSLLLRENGFKIIDMTEIDGLTYFCAQSLRSAEN
jgi:hypothetical protein